VRQGFDYKISAILQNITKKKKIIMVSFLLVAPPEARSETALLSQTAVLDEPNTPNRDDVPTMPNEDDDVSEDSEDSDVEILDDGSDMDIYEESELMKFSRMLCDAQKRALAEEKAKGIKQKTYDGNSWATVYRRKRYWSDLAAQGYLPVPEFMKLIDARKEKDKLTELAVEESEASSDDDTVTVSWCRSNEPSVTPLILSRLHALRLCFLLTLFVRPDCLYRLPDSLRTLPLSRYLAALVLTRLTMLTFLFRIRFSHSRCLCLLTLLS
jgi:hypothetical protein